MMLNVHKDLTDALDLVNIGRQFVGANEHHRCFFGNHNGIVWADSGDWDMQL